MHIHLPTASEIYSRVMNNSSPAEVDIVSRKPTASPVRQIDQSSLLAAAAEELTCLAPIFGNLVWKRLLITPKPVEEKRNRKEKKFFRKPQLFQADRFV